MATIMCPRCGTRNSDEMDTCRRCGAELGESPDSMTLIGEQWRITGSLPENPSVFVGKNIETNEKVAIKRLSKSASMDRTIRSRFLDEAELLKSISHEHMVRVLGVVADVATPAIVISSPEGESLRSMIRRLEKLPIPVAIAFALQLLNALDYLHARGIVHRSLSTDTIHVINHPETGLPHLVVTDFGLARAIHLDAAATGDTGTLVGMQVSDGTSHLAPTSYMAPETIDGEADSRADIYALGVLLFELITGRRPIGHGLQGDRLVEAIQTQPPTRLRLLRPEASSELEETLNRLMSKDPDRRFFDVSETRSRLLAISDATMVKIPSGPFIRGSEQGQPNARSEESPQQTLNISAFFVDRLPVTVRQFRAYLAATAIEPSAAWERHNAEDETDFPVVYVTWDEAAAYAKWAGKRLLTEAEWEKAARGTDAREFPWGDELPDAELACFQSEGRSTVFSHPMGASPSGCLDMAGNAFEWVQDWYNRDYYSVSPDTDPKGPNVGSKKVLRGGSFVHEAFALRVATRGRYAPNERRANHGFRCAWSLT